MIDDCLIKQTRKRRVAGDNGPRRNKMKEFGVIATDVPEAVIEEIHAIASSYTENDLRGDNYQISQHCNVDDAFTSDLSYRQILLQYLKDGSTDEVDEKNYTDWRSDIKCVEIEKFLQGRFKAPYRARISVLPPGGDINWHIDTDTSVLCRAQVPAYTEGSKFQWKTKQGETELEMEIGNAYFVNTGWTHRVVNESNNIRIVLIFGIDYDNIPNKEELLI